MDEKSPIEQLGPIYTFGPITTFWPRLVSGNTVAVGWTLPIFCFVEFELNSELALAKAK